MHMNRRGHAGREGRLQILGTEDAWAGLNRERTDVGQPAPAREVPPLSLSYTDCGERRPAGTGLIRARVNVA